MTLDLTHLDVADVVARSPLPPPSEPLLPLPKRMSKLDRRHRLMTAARELFGSEGYEATSIDAITSRAGVAVGAFYTHFRSKRQLLIVLMGEVVERFRDTDLRPRSSGTMQASLRSHITQMFEDDDRQLFKILRAWQEAAVVDAEIAAAEANFRMWTETKVLRLFRRLQRQPRRRNDLDIAVFAQMINVHMWALLTRAASMPPGELRREMRVTADAVYHYLFRDGA